MKAINEKTRENNLSKGAFESNFMKFRKQEDTHTGVQQSIAVCIVQAEHDWKEWMLEKLDEK